VYNLAEICVTLGRNKGVGGVSQQVATRRRMECRVKVKQDVTFIKQLKRRVMKA